MVMLLFMRAIDISSLLHHHPVASEISRLIVVQCSLVVMLCHGGAFEAPSAMSVNAPFFYVPLSFRVSRPELPYKHDCVQVAFRRRSCKPENCWSHFPEAYLLVCSHRQSITLHTQDKSVLQQTHMTHPLLSTLLKPPPIIPILIRNPRLNRIISIRLQQQIPRHPQHGRNPIRRFPLIRPQHTQTHAPLIIIRDIWVVDFCLEGEGGWFEGVVGWECQQEFEVTAGVGGRIGTVHENFPFVDVFVD